MAYDSSRGRTVLFGGRGVDGNPTADTWEFDGLGWTKRSFTGPTPPARLGAALAFDAARGRVVLFGGAGASAESLGDTWVFDGVAGTQLQIAGPAARFGHAMAYDAARQRVVLFGGDGDALPFGDTWEFNGSAWSQVTTFTIPPQRSVHAMAYDASIQSVVVVGGAGAFGTLSDTWTFNGLTWQEGPSAPRGVIGATLVYDSARGGSVLVGGYQGDTNTLYNDVSVFNGTEWSDLAPTGASPFPRFQHAAVFDAARQVTVVFSGSAIGSPADTWELAGSAWTPRTVSGSTPRPRSDHSTAFDAGRQRTVLFGGLGSLSETLDDTWEFDGSAWSEIVGLVVRPAPRQRFGFAYDAARQNTVLFGGQDDDGSVLDDTWTFNGTAWAQAAVGSQPPPARTAHAIAYDAARQKVVLFGGLQGFDFATFQSILLNDTWTFDGVAWTQLSPAVSPTPRASFQLAYDPVRQKTVLFGGENANGQLLGDTWEFDGTTWAQVNTPVSPTPRAVYGMAYNAA
ncbi:MAG: hypothetical protein K2Q20_12075, partial [Phycisphaerales bacterium]|nr:hypothetical protein [Phycisphaerales bacterium]